MTARDTKFIELKL